MRALAALALCLLPALAPCAVIKGLNTGANEYVFIRHDAASKQAQGGEAEQPDRMFMAPYVDFPSQKLRAASEGAFRVNTKGKGYVCTSMSGPACMHQSRGGEGKSSSGEDAEGAHVELVKMITSSEDLHEISQGFQGDWLVLFLHGRCPTCVKAGALMDEVARGARDVSVAVVDCEAGDICRSQGVTTLPDVRMLISRPDADSVCQVRWEGDLGEGNEGPRHDFNVRNFRQFILDSQFFGRQQPETPPKGDFVSQTSQKKQEVEFVNRRLYSMNLYWVDFAGREQQYHHLAPGAVARSVSYVGHVWVARDAVTKQLLGEHIVEEVAGGKYVGQIGNPKPVDPHYTWHDESFGEKGGGGGDGAAAEDLSALGMGLLGPGITKDEAELRDLVKPIVERIEAMLKEKNGGEGGPGLDQIDIEMLDVSEVDPTNIVDLPSSVYETLVEVDVSELARHVRKALDNRGVGPGGTAGAGPEAVGAGGTQGVPRPGVGSTAKLKPDAKRVDAAASRAHEMAAVRARNQAAARHYGEARAASEEGEGGDEGPYPRSQGI